MQTQKHVFLILVCLAWLVTGLAYACMDDSVVSNGYLGIGVLFTLLQIGNVPNTKNNGKSE